MLISRSKFIRVAFAMLAFVFMAMFAVACSGAKSNLPPAQITFDLQGATDATGKSMLPVRLEPGQKVPTLEEMFLTNANNVGQMPKLPEHHIVGYYKSIEGSGDDVVYPESEEIAVERVTVGELTLLRFKDYVAVEDQDDTVYVKWGRSLFFETGYFEDEDNTQWVRSRLYPVNEGETLKEIVTKPRRPGYTFAGYFVDIDFTVPFVIEDNPHTGAEDGEYIKRIYMKWIQN